MREQTTIFGINAGKIWDALNEKGCIKREELLEITNLDMDDFYLGLGWLARENKVSIDDEDCFKLDITNLEPEIGVYAGKIWKILDIWGDANLDTIKRLSDLDDDQVYTALGWLACEEKIWVNENNRFTLK